MRGNGAVLPATGVKTRDAFIITTQTVLYILYIGERGGGVRGGRGERERRKRESEREKKKRNRERGKRETERDAIIYLNYFKLFLPCLLIF